MTLMMYLGNDLIEAVPVSLDKLSQPGYLGGFKRLLKQKHALLLQETSIQPEFLVFDLNPVKTSPSGTSSYVAANSMQSMEASLASI